MTTLVSSPKLIDYPSSDGEPVAETYVHLYAIVTTLEVLKQYLHDRQATVLANQFLYYAENFPKLRVAPDVMVIFDVASGGRDNYKVWEEGQVPKVVFEMTSKGTQDQDRNEKKTLYESLGVEEYWLFDPKGEWIEERLRGYRLQDESYQAIADGRSAPLQLRVTVEGELLGFYREDTGEKLLIPTELAERLQTEVQARIEAESQLEQAQSQLEEERQRAEQAESQLEQERQAKELAQQRVEQLMELLRSQGINPDAF